MSPISPMPQARDEGMENSGTRIPARRGRGSLRLMDVWAVCKRSAGDTGDIADACDQRTVPETAMAS